MPNPQIAPPKLPEFLSKVPKSIVRALDLSEVFQDALICLKPKEELINNYAPVIALRMIESYFDAAKRQQKRIERAKVSIHRSTVAKSNGNLFREVHFYIISWAMIFKFAKNIRKHTSMSGSRIGLVIRKYNDDLEKRRDARNHLEHFDERLPGEKDHNRLTIPNDLLNIKNQYLTFGGSRVDIGPNSIILLKAFRDELFCAVLYDSLEAVANTDGSRLTTLFDKATLKVHIARQIRKAQ